MCYACGCLIMRLLSSAQLSEMQGILPKFWALEQLDYSAGECSWPAVVHRHSLADVAGKGVRSIIPAWHPDDMESSNITYPLRGG